MPRLSFIYRTDTHVSDKSPVSWKADYPAEIWSNLEQIGTLARVHGAAAVLDGGDFFHVKAASRNSHASVIKAAGLHKNYPCPTYCVEGNHDLAYNDLDSIEKQPLGVLYAAGVFNHLREVVFEDGGVRVRVVGVPYSVRRTLDDLRAIQKKPGDDFLIAVVHALASANPPSQVEDFFGEPVFRYGDLITEDGPDAWLFGHWHRDQGIVEIKGKHFINQGAVSRGALIHENVNRTPQVSLLEFERSGPAFRTLQLVVAPAADVFDFERKERIETETQSIDEFVAKLQEDAVFDSTATIESNVQSLDFAMNVRERALAYLARAREVG